jgi:hypothetical protein
LEAWAVTIWDTIPNPGRIRIYTSGCPKNQKRCWYKTGFPPPAGSKKDVLILRSVSSIVMAPARTGRLTIKRTAVMATDHKNSGSRDSLRAEDMRETRIVVRKLILPRIEDTPAR